MCLRKLDDSRDHDRLVEVDQAHLTPQRPKNLINRGAMTENVLGILVAPQFSSKVLNVVKGSSGVILRWFEMPM